MKKGLFVFCAMMLALATVAADRAQAQVQLPRLSPKASVTQTIGVTEVTITYSRPAVKNRVIWGELVPNNQVWRLGANEATSIAFGDDVTIEGQPLPKGTYSMHAIPNPGEWVIIFNKVAGQWGSYNYKQEEDALRVTVKSFAGPDVERMLFTFDDVTDESATVTLAWEKLRVAFKVGVNTDEKVMSSARSILNSRSLLYAAQYALQNNIEIEQAGKWLDASIALDESFQNLSLKADLLAREGKVKEAVKIGEKALVLGRAAQRVPPDLATFANQVAEWKSRKK